MARMTNPGNEKQNEWERKQGRAAGRRGAGPLVNTGRLADRVTFLGGSHSQQVLPY